MTKDKKAKPRASQTKQSDTKKVVSQAKTVHQKYNQKFGLHHRT